MTSGWISRGLECREETTAVDRNLEVTHTHQHTYIHTYIYIHVYIHIYTHIYTCIYTYIHTVYIYIRRIYTYIYDVYMYTRSEAVRVTETSQRES